VIIIEDLIYIRSLDQRVRRATTRPYNHSGEHEVANKTTSKRKEYTKDDVKLLKAHSKARTPVAKLSKLMKRSEGSLRQKARTLGIGLGHQR
jgi:hypothetical protein